MSAPANGDGVLAKRIGIAVLGALSVIPTGVGIATSNRIEGKVDALTSRLDRMEGANTVKHLEKLDERIREVELAVVAKEKR